MFIIRIDSDADKKIFDESVDTSRIYFVSKILMMKSHVAIKWKTDAAFDRYKYPRYEKRRNIRCGKKFVAFFPLEGKKTPRTFSHT